MTLARCLLFVPFTLLGACSHFAASPDRPVDTVRLQGELRQDAGQLVFQPCNEAQSLLLEDHPELDLTHDADALGAGSTALYADLRGMLHAATGSAPATLRVTQRYRLADEGASCTEDLRRTVLQASGNEPGWQVRIAAKGLVLERPGQPALALPYLEEQLPGGQSSFTSEANGQRLELWVAPQRCVDDMSGAVNHLAAELRLNGRVERGCAWFGGARHE